MRKQLQQLAAIITLVICIAAWILLTGAMFADLINLGQYILWMAVTGVILFTDAGWVSRHFVGGRWV